MKHYAERKKMSDKPDMVNHPPHYRSASGLESIVVIEAFNLNFNLGNVIKYILRKGRKGDPKQDLLKAQWYLNREIEGMEDAPKAAKSSVKSHSEIRSRRHVVSNDSGVQE